MEEIRNNNQSTNNLNDAIIKGFLAFLGSVLTASVVATFNTVQSTSIEIVRLQSRVTSLNDAVVTSNTAREARQKELNEKISVLENKISNVEMELRRR